MTKEEILNGMSEEEFYNLYPTEEAYFMAKGGSLSGAPHNGQPTADEFFSYGAPAFGHMNIPMSNPTYLAHGGTYFGGPLYPAQRGTATPVPAPNADAFMAKLDNPPLKQMQFPTFNTRSQYDKFKAGNVNFNKYSDADMQGLGVDVPAMPDRAAIKKQEEWNQAHPWTRSAGTTPEGAQLFHKTGQSGTPQNYFFNKSTSTYDPYNPAVTSTRPAIPAVTMAYGGSMAEYCWGGLPGGPNEMPKMNYGGYMDNGGYNSPTNYGSFSVPMSKGGYYQIGGTPKELVDWAAKEQEKLEERLKMGIPPNVKKYFGEYDEPRKFDSTHVYPNDPNIAMGFKGNKVMLISKDDVADNMVRRVNKPRTFVGPTVKGERDVYFDYLHPHEYGGILDANNNQEYPMMGQGGMDAYAFGGNYENLKSFLKTVSKANKKAFGGDNTVQGGNQDYISQRKSTYDSFLKKNVYNSLVDQEEEDISKAFMQMGGFQQPMLNPNNALYQQSLNNNMNQFQKQKKVDDKNFLTSTGTFINDLANIAKQSKGVQTAIEAAAQSSMPKAANGWEYSSEYKKDQKRSELIRAISNKKGIAINDKLSDDELIDMAKKEGIIVDNAKTDKQTTNTNSNIPWFQTLADYFPANSSRGYGLSNKDYSKLYNLTEGSTPAGIGVKYGPLARALGKTGRNLFGPKEIYMDIMHSAPTIQTKPYIKPPVTTKEQEKEHDIHVIRDPNRDMNLGPAIQPTANPNFNWNTTFGYGGYYQGGGNPIAMSNNWSFAGAEPPKISTPQAAGISNPEINKFEMKDTGAPPVSGDTLNNTEKDRISFKRKGIGKAFAKYAPALANTIASGLEARDYRKAQEDLANSQTADRMFLGSTGNRGDYDPNSGMFRPDQMVPVQFPGGMYGAYGGSFQDGGMYEEGEELDLSPEEIEELRAQGYVIEELD
jgi:hypothetical protein